MVEQHHNYTALLILLYAVLVLAGAIFLTVAYNRVRSSTDYARLEVLNSARKYLLVSLILGFIASALGMVLAFVYFGYLALNIKNETLHFILFFLLFALVIVSGILAFIALSKINSTIVADRNGAPGWIWAAEVVGLIALIVVIISGAWRAQYYSSKTVSKTVLTTTPIVATTITSTTPILATAVDGSPNYGAPVDVSNTSPFAPFYATVTETKTEKVPLSLPTTYMQPGYSPMAVVPNGSQLSSAQMYTPQYSVMNSNIPQYSVSQSQYPSIPQYSVMPQYPTIPQYPTNVVYNRV